MANLTSRINIHGRCRSHELWTGKVSAGDTLRQEGDALVGVRPALWSAQGSDVTERSFEVNEGETWRNIPLYTFNILQAAEVEPDAVVEIIYEVAPDIERKFDLGGIETGTRDWYIELVDALLYLSVGDDRYDDYGRRYWYQPWQKAKEKNPDLLGEGRMVIHPGADADSEDEDVEPEAAGSATEANW